MSKIIDKIDTRNTPYKMKRSEVKDHDSMEMILSRDVWGDTIGNVVRAVDGGFGIHARNTVYIHMQEMNGS